MRHLGAASGPDANAYMTHMTRIVTLTFDLDKGFAEGDGSFGHETCFGAGLNRIGQ